LVGSKLGSALLVGSKLGSKLVLGKSDGSLVLGASVGLPLGSEL
jgi:hypothetical protein